VLRVFQEVLVGLVLQNNLELQELQLLPCIQQVLEGQEDQEVHE
jgi:hypothetical protein